MDCSTECPEPFDRRVRVSTATIDSGECHGCGACVAACSREAARITLDETGFLRPVIASEKCTGCGQCLRVCPLVNGAGAQTSRGKIYYAWAESSQIRLFSSSGGAALCLSLAFCRQGSSVIGATYSPDFRQVHHVVTSSPETVLAMSGSKYVQSLMTDAIKKAMKHCPGKGLVIGTPCQIHGIRNLVDSGYLNRDLTLVDLACHGVPSYLFWWAFVDELQGRVGRLRHIELRHKVKDWHEYHVRAIGEAGVYLRRFEDTRFGRFYLSNYGLCEPCYSCRYRTESAADLRLGDFWGSEFRGDRMGVSLVIALSDKGTSVLESTPGLYFHSHPGSAAPDHPPIVKPLDGPKALEHLRLGASLEQAYVRYLAGRYVAKSILESPVRLARRVLPKQVEMGLRTTLNRLAGRGSNHAGIST